MAFPRMILWEASLGWDMLVFATHGGLRDPARKLELVHHARQASRRLDYRQRTRPRRHGVCLLGPPGRRRAAVRPAVPRRLEGHGPGTGGRGRLLASLSKRNQSARGTAS